MKSFYDTIKLTDTIRYLCIANKASKKSAEYTQLFTEFPAFNEKNRPVSLMRTRVYQ